MPRKARIYDKSTKKTNPKRVTIGKKSEADPTKMQPNENYLKYFPDEDVPEVKDRSARSSCLRIGAWLVIKKVIEEYRLTDILSKYISMKDLGLVMDLAAYSIITENNAGQYYPEYAMQEYRNTALSIICFKAYLFYEENLVSFRGLS